MGEGSNPLGALLGFWMLMQLVSVLLTLIGGLYALWCLNRIAGSNEQNTVTLERLAAATERLAQQNNVNAANVVTPNVSAPAAPVFPAPVPASLPVQPPVAPVEAVPFTPATPTPPNPPFPVEPPSSYAPPAHSSSSTEENRPL